MVLVRANKRTRTSQVCGNNFWRKWFEVKNSLDLIFRENIVRVNKIEMDEMSKMWWYAGAQAKSGIEHKPKT